MSYESASKKIFVVYSSHESELVEALAKLMKRWFLELKVFYFQQPDRPSGNSYREQLAKELAESSVVLLLLSRGFQWSKYCQFEAGAAAALDGATLRQIPILIPPAEKLDEICPAFHGVTPIVATDPRPKEKKPHQNEATDPAKKEEKPHRFVSALKKALLMAPGFEEWAHATDLNNLEKKVEDALKSVIESYESTPSRIEVCDIWNSIDENDQFASESVVRNIRLSLEDADKDTTVTLVGVSLKYSLGLLNRALEAYSSSAGSIARARPKKLCVKLVYMDDNSRVLHVLNDWTDINRIRKSLLEEGGELIRKWPGFCADAKMGLEIERIPIDYIPLRIGILIDDAIFYAGRCRFGRAGDDGSEFRLLVGEKEYFYYTNANDRGKEMIREFKSFLDVYRKKELNGIELSASPVQWIARMQDCIESRSNRIDPESDIIEYRSDIREVILIAQTFTKFHEMVPFILERGIDVKLYAQWLGDDRDLALKDWLGGLQESIVQDVTIRTKAKAKLFYFHELPTFRAALIGQEMIGVQLYVPIKPKKHGDSNRASSPVRIIATKHSPRFELLRGKLIYNFLQTAEREPKFVIDLDKDSSGVN